MASRPKACPTCGHHAYYEPYLPLEVARTLASEVEQHVAETADTYSQIARRLGWIRPGGRGGRSAVGDATRLKRRLGMVGNQGYRQSTMRRDTALQILSVIPTIDPVDVGL